MSRILRRPMFRGGGKVSSYGNGIASGMGYASGGRVGYETGGNILSNIYNNLTSPAINPETNTPYTAAETQAMLKGTRDQMNAMLGFTPIGRSARGLNVVRSAYSKFPGFRSGLPSASKVKDFFTKSPQSASKELGTYKGPAPFGTDRFVAEKLRPMFQNTGAALKDVFGGAGKLKDYKTAIGVGGVGGGFGLSKLYEGFKERQIGSEPSGEGDGLTDAEKEAKRLQEELYKLRTAQAYGNPTEEQSSAEYKETVVDKKARLKEKAKEYEDILGAGIKKDSIFDAMVEGGTRLMEGEGFAGSLRAANKALDPIQNIRTASRKLALEEDIALRKAIAVGAAKDTDMSRRIAALKAGGYTPEQIADAVAGTGRPKSKADYIKDTNSATTGLTLWVKDNVPDLKSLLDKKAIKDPKVTASLEDGKHYIPELFTLITIKEGVVVDKEKLK